MRPPSVDRLARSLADLDLPHPLLVDAARQAIAAGDPESARGRAEAVAHALLRPVVNATGVLLHTNLGRAPVALSWPPAYANVELDLPTGRRGSRSAHAAALLARACGAEAALVVNNGAAAVLLTLAALASRRPVAVSRGELVEIGGGFRVPDVLRQSGAKLVEVGTTNRTNLADYRDAAATHATMAAVLKVHQSNFRVVGFTAGVGVRPLARLGLPVIVDLGSGLLDAACPWLADGPPAWLADEPAARQTLEAGAALVTFSGDKLLGGPQAGVIAGRADLVARCARHPLARALRPGGLVLAALQQTTLAYLRRDAGETVPFWRMASAPVDALRQRATGLGVGEVIDCESVAGGGSAPGLGIASAGVAIAGDVLAELRAADPPIIARVHDDRTVCDLRTVDPADDAHLARAPRGRRDVGRQDVRVVATAGHVDHGKSSLVLALTGTDPDRFAEEKRRGLTIDIGFAWCTLPSGAEVSFVDVPGHVRFIKNMLAGVGAVDACLFVVAATEGWKPQSEEHLRILELLGVRHGVVALTKAALVDADMLELAADDVASHLDGTFLASAPAVAVDSLSGTGLDELRVALEALVADVPDAVDVGRPRLWVDRSFPARGAGTVVTGTLTGGTLHVDDDVLIAPSGRRARVGATGAHAAED